MNVKLLRKVIKHISGESRRLEMAVFGEKVDPSEPDSPPCGTTACIAGWSMILSGKYKLTEKGFPYDDSAATELLGIDGYQANRLFYVGEWPKKFRDRHDTAKTPRGRSSAAVARIESFIKTNGAE